MAAAEKSIKEGQAEVYLPASVFYNPVQEFNRDLTIAVIREFIKTQIVKGHESSNKNGNQFDVETAMDSNETKPCAAALQAPEKHDNGVRILEALAASGLRSVRFAKEIGNVKQIVANDFDETAVQYIQRNIEHNDVRSIVTPSHGDASLVMYQNRKVADRFHIIDLDPYGSAAQFLDAAVQSLQDGGLLCVTCTDVAILCGNAPETCHAKYGSVSLRASFSHEMALRIVLRCIESHANVYSRYIVPILAVSVDFYVRVFVRIFTSQNAVKESATKVAMVLECTGCGSMHLQPLATKVSTSATTAKYMASHGPAVGLACSLCGGRHRIGGPIWSGPLHDMSFVERLLDSVRASRDTLNTSDRIIGLLNLVTEELVDVPLYYVVDDLCRTLHCTLPRFIQFRSAIMNAGFRVSLSHADKNSLKTDAPHEVIWDILRCWVRDHPVREERLQGDSVASRLLAVSPKQEADFTERADANPTSRAHGLLRWQHNPLPNWGPQARATHGEFISLEERRQKGMEKARKRKRAKKSEPEDLRRFPCKMFKEGKCTRDPCRYSHDVPSTESESANVEMMLT